MSLPFVVGFTITCIVICTVVIVVLVQAPDRRTPADDALFRCKCCDPNVPVGNVIGGLSDMGDAADYHVLANVSNDARCHQLLRAMIALGTISVSPHGVFTMRSLAFYETYLTYRGRGWEPTEHTLFYILTTPTFVDAASKINYLLGRVSMQGFWCFYEDRGVSCYDFTTRCANYPDPSVRARFISVSNIVAIWLMPIPPRVQYRALVNVIGV